MSNEGSSIYFNRQTDPGRTPNTDFPPFVTKTRKNETIYPVYTPYDATSTVQGVVWLTDDVESSGKNAENGMTAVTPKGTKDYTESCIKKHSFYLGTEESVENDTDDASPSNKSDGTSFHVKAFSAKSITSWELDESGTTPPVVFTPDAPELSFKNQVYFGKIGTELGKSEKTPIFYGGLALDPAPTITISTGRDAEGNDTHAEVNFTGNENVDLTLPYISDDEIAQIFNSTVDNDHVIITTVVTSGAGEPPSEGVAGSVYIKYSE